MTVEELDLAFALTVAHSPNDYCPGEARVGYKIGKGKFALVFSCSEDGCKPKPFMIRDAAPSVAPPQENAGT
jgi:hypothetical protein